ncbi:MAG: hypothetical protein C5B50_00315 [Verrucomicrobia bacterium]|nr:MAG: hypothetical protein C5B50_00315 [Verrucomicrobiota bacterium]
MSNFCAVELTFLKAQTAGKAGQKSWESLMDYGERTKNGFNAAANTTSKRDARFVHLYRPPRRFGLGCQ